MIRKLRDPLLLASIVLQAEVSFAASDLAVDLALLYLDQGQVTESDSGTKTSQGTVDTYLHGGVCYFISGDACLGIKYVSKEKEIETSVESSNASAESVDKQQWSGLGLSVGYRYNQVNVRASYLIDGQYERATTSYFGGPAYMLEAGYGFKVNSAMIGPMLSYGKFSYTKTKVGSVETELANELSDEWVIPSIAVWLLL